MFRRGAQLEGDGAGGEGTELGRARRRPGPQQVLDEETFAQVAEARRRR